MRKKFIIWLFEHSQRIYITFKKKKPWRIKESELYELDSDSFGYHLGLFLKKNSFHLIPKVERHDAYHVMTNYGTEVQDEIALQYLCFGNGKRSPYLFGVIILGTLILPDYLNYYIDPYKTGKDSHPFHNLNYENLLERPLHQLRSVIFNHQQLSKILS